MMKKTVVRVVIVALAALVWGCSNPSGGGNSTVSAVTVTPNPATTTVGKGRTQTFTAAVTGTNGPAQTVTWTIDEPFVSGTAITTGGVLTVAAGESAASLTVRAVSTVDTGKSGTAAVTVITPLPEQITALAAGTSGSPTVFTLPGGTYPMTRDDAISLNNKHIHIKVPSGETALIQLTEALDNANDGLFHLNNATLILGEDSGGGTLIIDGGNQAEPPVTGTGSLIRIVSGSSMEIKNGVTLRNNTSTGPGGAIYLFSGNTSGRAVLKISGGTISGNKATWGGGIAINAYTTLTMTGGIIEYNTATTDSGGGIASWNGSEVSIENSWPVITISDGEIRDNQAAAEGGGVYSYAKFTLTAGTIHHNSAQTQGGGIFRYNPSHTNSSFSVPTPWAPNVYDNTAGTGPQIYPAP
jgi:hypothetical protein